MNYWELIKLAEGRLRAAAAPSDTSGVHGGWSRAEFPHETSRG